MSNEPRFRAFFARRYDLTKAAFFMQEIGWRLWGTVFSFGRVALIVAWRERK